MTFTDDDLKRLKEMMGDYSICKRCSFDYNDISALLVRLEASESVSNQVCCGCRENLQKELAHWRKLCGI